MADEDASELTALRAEIAQIRRELDEARERLDLPTARFPASCYPEYPRMEFEQVSVRHEKMHIPVVVHADAEESGVYLYDEKHRLRGNFAIGTDGLARLEIRNAEGKVVVSLSEAGDGRGELRANDADGTTRAGMKVSENGGAVSVVTPQGKTLAALASGPEGGKVFVCTPEPKGMVTLMATAQGGMVVLSEPGGQTMASLAVTESGAALNIHGEQGERVAVLSGLGELGGMLVFYTPEGEVKTMLP